MADLVDRPLLFGGVKFYGIGFSDSVEDAIIGLGGQRIRYLSDEVTHVIVGTKMHTDHEVTEALDLYTNAQVVDESWAISSILLNKVLHPEVFSPVAMSFFDGLVVSFTELAHEDKKRLWFMLSHHGAICLLVLENRCNVLIAGRTSGLKYQKALKMNSTLSIVTPDWVVDSLVRGKLLGKQLYHPKLLNAVKEDFEEDRSPLKLEPLQISEDIFPPDLSMFKIRQSQSTTTVKKGISKFVKANIQFFHSGHGAPPALADKERTKRRDQQAIQKAALLSSKSPISSLTTSCANSSISNNGLVTNNPGMHFSHHSEPLNTSSITPQNKFPRIICLPRKLPLRRQGDPKREPEIIANEFNFSVPEDKPGLTDNRVPPECCRRGCRFLVSDFKKFVSPAVLTGLKDFISGKSFDCSCPCHFFPEDLINDINRQGAFSESNPRIKALLDLQRLVQSIPPAFQTDFLHNTLYSQSANSPFKQLLDESKSRIEGSGFPKYQDYLNPRFDLNRGSSPSLQEAFITSEPNIPKLKIMRDKSPGSSQGESPVFKTKFVSKVNPAMAALYSKYTASIKQMDGKRIVMVFKRTKTDAERFPTKSETLTPDKSLRGRPRKKPLNGENWVNPDSPEYVEVTTIGRFVNVYWDEKQVSGTQFSAGWYSGVVTAFNCDTDQIHVEHIEEPGRVYKIPVTITLLERKLRPKVIVDDFPCPTPPPSNKSEAPNTPGSTSGNHISSKQSSDPFSFDDKMPNPPVTPEKATKRSPCDIGMAPSEPKLKKWCEKDNTILRGNPQLSSFTSLDQKLFPQTSFALGINTTPKMLSPSCMTNLQLSPSSCNRACQQNSLSHRVTNALLTPPSDSAMPPLLDEPLVANDILAEDLMPAAMKHELDLEELLLGPPTASGTSQHHNSTDSLLMPQTHYYPENGNITSQTFDSSQAASQSSLLDDFSFNSEHANDTNMQYFGSSSSFNPLNINVSGINSMPGGGSGGYPSPVKDMNSTNDLFEDTHGTNPNLAMTSDFNYSPPKSIFNSTQHMDTSTGLFYEQSIQSQAAIYSTASNHERLDSSNSDYYEDPENALTTAESGNLFLTQAEPPSEADSLSILTNANFLSGNKTSVAAIFPTSQVLESPGTRMQKSLEPSGRVQSSAAAGKSPGDSTMNCLFTGVSDNIPSQSSSGVIKNSSSSRVVSSRVTSRPSKPIVQTVVFDDSSDEEEVSQVKADALSILVKLDF